MKKNQTDATKRVATPIPFVDLDGNLLGSQTFATGSGEVETFSLTSGWVAAAANASEDGAGSGIYRYTFSQAETNYDTVIAVRLKKTGYATQSFFVPIEIITVDDVNTAITSLASQVTTVIATLATLATAAQANTIIASVAALPSAAAIRDAVLNELLSNHSIEGSVADGIAIAAGLLQGNFYIDNVDNNDPNGQTTCRMRLFRSGTATLAATDGGSGEGEFATFTVETEYAGPNKIKTHRVYREAG